MPHSREESPSLKPEAGPARASSRGRVVQFADTSTTIVFEQQAVRYVKSACLFYQSPLTHFFLYLFLIELCHVAQKSSSDQ
jgi:hypothetical protein